MSGQVALRGRLIALYAGLGLIGLHWGWTAARAHHLGSAGDFGILHYWLTAALLLAGGLLVWAGRTTWHLRRARQDVSDLAGAPWPAKLRGAARRAGMAGTGTVVCVRDPRPVAFCVGAIRPRVVVTSGLVEQFGADELTAVLLHEGEHARRRDPLRRAAWRAAAEVLWHIPLVEWWHQRHLERSELAADRVAIARLGRGPLARALTLAVPPGGGPHQAGFDGAGALRVAQLLGDPLPVRGPTRGLYLLSACAALLPVNLGVCLFETVAYLAR